MRVLVKTIDAPTGGEQQGATDEQVALGRRLTHVRKNAGITQEEWADTLGRSSQAVSAWEAGRNLPAVEIFLQYERHLGVDLHWLLTGKRYADSVHQVQALIKMLEVGKTL